jgi:UDP-glucose-4-epimerase
MRILITGATGYIGSHTVVELLNAGFDVIGVDNFSNSKPEVLDGIEHIVGKKPDFMQLDCTDYTAFEQVFIKYPDICAVIHFAASKAVGESVEQPLKYFNNNLRSILNLIDLMKNRAKSANIVFSSSCTVYGQPDEKHLPVDENAPLQVATSPYGRTKQMCEDILHDCVVAYDSLKVIALRYFNPIGAHPSSFIGELPNGVPQNLVPYITQTAAGIRNCLSVFGDDYSTPDGSCIRDYIYVVDLAKAHVKAVERLLNVRKDNIDNKDNQAKRYEVFNLGTGKGLSVLELVNAFINATGVKLNYKIAPRRSGDIEQVWANPSKANKILGWKADTPIEEVLLSAWKWQKSLK